MEQHKQMKQDLYIIKALRSKGYDIEEVMAMTIEEIEALPLPQRIINNAKDYKERGAKPVEVIKEKIFEDISIDETSRNVKPEVIEEYVENSEEQEKALEEVKQIVEEQQEPEEEDVVVIERIEASKEDLDIIKSALQTKELKTVSAYIKHLKAEVPEAILSAVDSTVVSRLVNERIAEVKEKR